MACVPLVISGHFSLAGRRRSAPSEVPLCPQRHSNWFHFAYLHGLLSQLPTYRQLASVCRLSRLLFVLVGSSVSLPWLICPPCWASPCSYLANGSCHFPFCVPVDSGALWSTYIYFATYVCVLLDWTLECHIWWRIRAQRVLLLAMSILEFYIRSLN